MKLAKYLFIFLSLSYFICGQVLSADCDDASGTVTISTSCTALDISGDGSNVTVNSGVTIDATKGAVATGNAANATITNNAVSYTHLTLPTILLV